MSTTFLHYFCIVQYFEKRHFLPIIIDIKKKEGRIMKLYESAEDYLESILMLRISKGYVRSIDVATDRGFSKPSVSRAMKNLRTDGYIEMDEKGYISLTEKGEAVAQSVYERHKLFSSMLIKLGVDEETALKDACRMEHALSPESFSKIKAYVEKHLND